ncbi:dTDP-glucose 4,6-dehydratase [Candidatus Nitrosotenuis chungbukensis]|uniref:dTDP-glucose 4,6-dehydratase n=1 Tax=Candidatus Nitrosotenuis chungbukensis TaxID=1353246 RepID=UPI0005B284E2|nr:dTDP-glucose 4,6-dehydratase [Candidatus Nitrosotenuis chungbukensis]
MKLLVTGGLGFIGSNFILHILKNYPNYKIVNVDDELPGSNRLNLTEIENSDNYRFVKGNITDQVVMEKLIRDCDQIINFAAESHVDRSIANAKPFIDSNIIGVFTILELLKKHKKRLIQISTDEVFGNLKSGSAIEDSKLNPSSPYSSSKASAELLVNSYIITYGVKAIITRCTNNYGPRQFIEKLIPKTIILAYHDKKIPIYNNGKGMRDWIHVDDHCSAISTLIHDGIDGEKYNIAAQNEYDVLTVVKKILSIMGKPSDNFEFAENRPGHDDRYSMDSTKIQNTMQWKPKIDFEQGLTDTVNWYLNNKNWWSGFDLKILDGYQWKS